MDGRLQLDQDGRLLVARPALPGEAARLRALAGLPVPEVVEERDDTLVVTWLPPADDITAVAAEVAATLAAAHELGVAHGPLLPEHVRAGGVLDGWVGGDPVDDVASLGHLLLAAAPVPRNVAALARRATADAPDARPTMRALADAFAPAPVAAPVPRQRPQVPRWVPAAAALPIALAALVAGGGDAPADVVPVELRCPDATAPAALDAGTGELRLRTGDVLAQVPPDCEVVLRQP